MLRRIKEPLRNAPAIPSLEPLLRAADRRRSAVALFALAGGLLSLAAGTDVNWDLRNYHFYDAWALLHGRLGVDIAPAQVQTYYNPLLDVPFYALVRAGLPAFAVTFLMGLPYGLAMWFFWRIARLALADAGVRRPVPALAAVLLVAVTAAAGWSVVGSTMNDWSASLPIVASLWLAARAVRDPGVVSAPLAAVAGLLAGIAAGLKLTTMPFALAVFIALASCLHGRRGYAKAMAALVACALAGFVVAYGWWAAQLWERFRNPVFPYFNALFRSQWWDLVNFRDERFVFARAGTWIGLPFKLVERNQLVSESTMRDPRLALLVLLALALTAGAIAQARANGRSLGAQIRTATPPSVRFLIVFAIVAYAAWLALFRIYRYVVPLELVCCLLLVLAMRAAFAGSRYADALAAVLCIATVASTAAPNWGRAPLSAGPYFRVRAPSLAPNALVTIFTGEPVGYVVPYFDPNVRFIRPASNFTGPAHDNRLQREIDALASSYEGPMYVIRYRDRDDATEDAMLRRYRLRRDDGACSPIESDREKAPLVVCPLVRLAR